MHEVAAKPTTKNNKLLRSIVGAYKLKNQTLDYDLDHKTKQLSICSRPLCAFLTHRNKKENIKSHNFLLSRIPNDVDQIQQNRSSKYMLCHQILIRKNLFPTLFSRSQVISYIPTLTCVSVCKCICVCLYMYLLNINILFSTLVTILKLWCSDGDFKMVSKQPKFNSHGGRI